MNLKPLHDRVLIRRIEVDEEVRRGIVIPETAKEKPQEGEVVAVGDGKIRKDGKTTPLSLRVGDRVLVGKYAGTEVKIDDEDYVILREDEVLGVLAGRKTKVKA